jgi:Glutamine phosphoribosylpyrophosphate amidotransferase
MGGVFGVISKSDCVTDVFFGTDYHSHLGTKNGGMCILQDDGFNRSIHSISNAAFRSKFDSELAEMQGKAGIGALSDGDPQPLTIKSRQGFYAVATVGRINNKKELVDEIIGKNEGLFMSMSGNGINDTELVASLISEKDSIVDGIRNVQEKIDGSMTMLVLTEEGLYAARDKFGRTPLIIGCKDGESMCAASESFTFINLGYHHVRDIGPGEVVLIQAESEKTVVEPQKEMRICAFLWSYFGYPPATYEGQNVEDVRNRNGALIAESDGPMDVDYVAGVPDSGVAHALGYAGESGITYARPLIKYTPTWPRSFMPPNQNVRNLIAKMKLVPVFELIHGKKFVLVDDSIVRGTQLRETVSYLIDNGAEKIHVRSACPPIMFGCKYLNFSRSVSDNELIARRCVNELEGLKEGETPTWATLQEYADSHTEKHQKLVDLIQEKMQFDSLKFQDLDKLIEAIAVPECKLCTYCWNGKE